MVYPNLRFPKRTNRPFFYTNFVSTVDGKVQVLKNARDYWPIGSKADYQLLLELRAHADCLIHGKNLAQQFGETTLKSLENSAFKKMRKQLGKQPALPYYIISHRPAALADLEPRTTIVSSDLAILAKKLHKAGFRNVLVEGGPHLLTSFLKINLIDEIFLTITPRIFGNALGSALTLVEGYLFPKNAIINLSLLSVKKLESEIYLRYQVLG